MQPVDCPCGARLGRHDARQGIYRESRVKGEHERRTMVVDGAARTVVVQYCPACGRQHELAIGQAA